MSDDEERPDQVLLMTSIASTIMVAIGLGDMPYGFYMLLRIILCGAAIITSLCINNLLHRYLVWTFTFFAILYNPLIPIRLGDKEIWMVLNIITLVIFWSTFFILKRKLIKAKRDNTN